jgi:hypothetical protein
MGRPLSPSFGRAAYVILRYYCALTSAYVATCVMTAFMRVVSCTFSPVIKFKDEPRGWHPSVEVGGEFNGLYHWYILLTYVMITLTDCATTAFANHSRR